jgi:hypothetical protein
MNNGITIAWTTNGNVKGLLMSLSSVLLGSEMPSSILIRFDGQFPSFGEFYLEQISELCRIKDVSFAVIVEKECGVHQARESLLNNSPSDYVFMVDDDVILEYDAVQKMTEAARFCIRREFQFPFICGGKIDVNNRRGYGDFSLEPVLFTGREDCSTHLLYHFKDTEIHLCKITAADSGCMLVNRPFARNLGVTFAPKDVTFKVGGEDTLFGIMCVSKGHKGYFCPNVIGWHLEKSVPNFGQHEARAEIILRTAESLQLADGKTEFQAMKWVKPYRKE